MTSPPLIAIEGVARRVLTSSGVVDALGDVSLSVNEGDGAGSADRRHRVPGSPALFRADAFASANQSFYAAYAPFSSFFLSVLGPRRK